MNDLIGIIAIVVISGALLGIRRTTARIKDITDMEAGLAPATARDISRVNDANAADRRNLSWLWALAIIGVVAALTSVGG